MAFLDLLALAGALSKLITRIIELALMIKVALQTRKGEERFK